MSCCWLCQMVQPMKGLLNLIALFDYGDSHEFEVEVVDIRPNAEPGVYPRVVDKKGSAPSQYR